MIRAFYFGVYDRIACRYGRYFPDPKHEAWYSRGRKAAGWIT